MSAVVANKRFPWGHDLDEGMSLPTYQPGLFWQTRMSAEIFSLMLLYEAPITPCCSLDLLQDICNQCQSFPAQCQCHSVWVSRNLLLQCWFLFHCRAQPDRHLTFNSFKHGNEHCSTFIKGLSFLAGKLLKKI